MHLIQSNLISNVSGPFEYDSQLLESELSIQTGVINVEIVPTEHLVGTVPYTESINGKKVLFSVEGRPSLCLKCNEVKNSKKNNISVIKSNDCTYTKSVDIIKHFEGFHSNLFIYG